MINNVIKRAEIKLSQHKILGKKTNLSVFEVAQLMDTLKKGEMMNDSRYQQSPSMFFSYTNN